MSRLRLLGWWKRQTRGDLRDTLSQYEEQAEAHSHAAEMGRSVGSEAACAHQMELKDWYEREAGKLRRELFRQEQDRLDR